MEKEKYHYIYIITNLLDNKKYIGKHSTFNINDGYMGSGTKIKEIIKQGNKNKLKKEIIEFCSSEEIAYEREKYWIKYYNAVESDEFYNIKDGGEGFPCSQKEEIKQKIRQKALEKGIWQGDNNPGHIRAKELRGEGNPFYGKKHTEETKQKIREYRLGKKLSEETKLKIKENAPGKRAIQCIENEIIYPSIREAARCVGLKSSTGIIKFLQGNASYAGKDELGKPLHWRYVDETENN